MSIPDLVEKLLLFFNAKSTTPNISYNIKKHPYSEVYIISSIDDNNNKTSNMCCNIRFPSLVSDNKPVINIDFLSKCHVSETSTIRRIIQFCKIHDYNVTLTDMSELEFRSQSSDKLILIDLRELKLLQSGDTWYGKFGFKNQTLERVKPKLFAIISGTFEDFMENIVSLRSKYTSSENQRMVTAFSDEITRHIDAYNIECDRYSDLPHNMQILYETGGVESTNIGRHFVEIQRWLNSECPGPDNICIDSKFSLVEMIFSLIENIFTGIIRFIVLSDGTDDTIPSEYVTILKMQLRREMYILDIDTVSLSPISQINTMRRRRKIHKLTHHHNRKTKRHHNNIIT